MSTPEQVNEVAGKFPNWKIGKNKRICFFCSKKDHIISNCPTRPEVLPKKLPFYRSFKSPRPQKARKQKETSAKTIIVKPTFNGTVNFN